MMNDSEDPAQLLPEDDPGGSHDEVMVQLIMITFGCGRQRAEEAVEKVYDTIDKLR